MKISQMKKFFFAATLALCIFPQYSFASEVSFAVLNDGLNYIGTAQYPLLSGAAGNIFYFGEYDDAGVDVNLSEAIVYDDSNCTDVSSVATGYLFGQNGGSTSFFFNVFSAVPYTPGCIQIVLKDSMDAPINTYDHSSNNFLIGSIVDAPITGQDPVFVYAQLTFWAIVSFFIAFIVSIWMWRQLIQ